MNAFKEVLRRSICDRQWRTSSRGEISPSLICCEVSAIVVSGLDMIASTQCSREKAFNRKGHKVRGRNITCLSHTCLSATRPTFLCTSFLCELCDSFARFAVKGFCFCP